jgi:hypothetical protein
VNRTAALVLLSLLGSSPLAAQAVLRPPPPLDSARAELRDALVTLRDSLVTIDGAAARLQRDYRQASAASLLSRARLMRDACDRSVRAVPSARASVHGFRLSEPVKVKQRQEVVAALDHLKAALAECDTQFTAMSQQDQAEQVRGYANARAVQVQAALRDYEHVLRQFLGAMGIRVIPLGVTSGPTK